MRKQKRIIAFFMILLLVFSAVVAFANEGNDLTFEYNIDDDTGIITFFGTSETKDEGAFVTIQMLKKGKSTEDISEPYAGILKDDFVLITQVPIDGGDYSASADMTGESDGYYIVRVSGISEEKEIYFTSKLSKTALLDSIKAVLGKDESDEVIDELTAKLDLSNDRGEIVNSFAIDDDKVFEADESGLSEMIYTMFGDNPDELTIYNFKENIILAAYLEGLSEGTVNVSDYPELFGLDGLYIDAYNNLGDEAKTGFSTEYFAGKGYSSKDKVAEEFEAAVLKELCSSFEVWSDVKEYIEIFGEDSGVNVKTYNLKKFTGSMKSKLYAYVLDRGPYDSAEDFADTANKKIEDLLEDKANSKSPGSSGGGGGGGISPSTAIKPVEVTESTEEIPKTAFSDMAGFEWAKDSVDSLAEKGIVSGIGDNKFEPQRNVTREEMLAMLIRAYGVSAEDTAGNTFTDVQSNAWYCGYLAAGKSNGYVSGKPDGSFGVGEAVTREDAAVMAYNISKAMGKTFAAETGGTFADDDEISSYATEAVYALKNADVISGKGDGMFTPKASCTRAEAAVIIFLLITK